MTKAKKKVTVGSRIEEARTSYRMSQSQLGAALKVTRAAISLYEKDRNRPRAEVLDRLAELFGAAPEWFTHGRGDEPRPADLPVAIREIDPSLITAKMTTDLAGAKTGRQWSLPGSLLDCADHIVGFTAANHADPVSAGDRVVVDLGRRTAADGGVFLIHDAAGARLWHAVHDRPLTGATVVLGRVVGYLRKL